MPKKSKQFIDKKNAVTFHLVHRSQRDPLQADDEAPQHVLLPVDGNDVENNKELQEEQRKYGVFFEDNYNYLQHLKDVDELHDVKPVAPVEHVRAERQSSQSNATTFSLPSSVFASSVETGVGLLNKAAPAPGPKLDWDPDIVAALDEDFDFSDPDNELDDDFILKANDDGSGFSDVEEDDVSCNDDERMKEDESSIFKPVQAPPESKADNEAESESDDIPSDAADVSEDDQFSGSDIGSYEDRCFEDVETKSRFTTYSMTSSVIRRNEGLTLLDDRFEKLYEEYDDDDIGALDHEEIGGCLNTNSLVLNSAVEEFEQQQQVQKLKDVVKNYTDGEVDCVSSEEDNDDDLVKMKMQEPGDKWDCESILSTYSNIYNHPKLIEEPKKENPLKLTKRTEIPAGVLPQRGLTRRQLEAEEREQTRVSLALTHRPKDETSQERHDRKQTVKDERKMRRMEKKMNKLAFKEESIRQKKEQNNLTQNMQGVPIS